MRSEEDLTLAIAAVLERHQRVRPLAEMSKCNGGTAHCPHYAMSREEFYWHQARCIIDEEIVADYAVLKAQMEAALIETERAHITQRRTAYEAAEKLGGMAPIIPPAFGGPALPNKKSPRGEVGPDYVKYFFIGMAILVFIVFVSNL